MLAFKRTGKITLRAEPYLIMRLPGNPPYLALYGPQCARITIGRYDIATDAMRACQGHADAMQGDADPLTDTGQKKPGHQAGL